MYSTIDYFIQIKIQQACQLLDYSNLRINEISSRIGYEDPYYFSRIFKKVTGVSPDNYKKDIYKVVAPRFLHTSAA